MSQAAVPVLHYFGIPGRAEPIRVLCVANDIEWVDETFGFPEWPAKKEKTPYGSVPVLTIGDGPAIPQSNAILRYFGKLCGAYPVDPVEAAHADAVLDALEECTAPNAPSMREQDVDKKKAMREAWAKDHLHPWAAKLQKHHEALGNPTFFVGNKLSIVDYKIAALVGWLRSGALDFVAGDSLDTYPAFKASFDGVYGQEKVKAWKAAQAQKK